MSSNKIIVTSVVSVIVISGIAWMVLDSSPKDETLKSDNINTSIDTVNVVNTNSSTEILYQYTGLLNDVSGGVGFGEAKANFEDNKYDLIVSFENLPVPSGTDYYEGWIVRNDDQSVISTGKVIIENGIYMNNYTSEQDLTDHDYYILTLETDDGDPAPAKHILEGQLSS